ncbi:cadherin-like beta sandwich domain-containing protein [Paenibacillus sp. FSL K6-2524]|uniref:cadherin-like beta sandwich domain-containing protein n=1 Tax=Paenibacillus sp. FSL K6-2524 TaxID=2954516 RepID=UPI0030F7AA5A
MTRISRKLTIMALIILFTTGIIPGKFGAGVGGISAVAAATNITSQDGIGYSGPIAANEVVGTAFTGYQAWPSGFSKGSSAFVGGVYDGTSIWMIPYNANEILKVNPSTGEMTGYSNWPAGFTKGSNAFAGGVYDGTNIWLIPYSADQIIKVNATTGVMTGYSSWPGGSKGSDQFIGGAFDGTNIWLAPYSGSRLIKVDAMTGGMTSYNSWPSGTVLGSYPFIGSIFDGTSIWLIPSSADRLIKVDPSTGEMTGYTNWPSGFTKSADAFWGGVFDGTNIWLIPNNATHVVKINTTTGVMTGYNGWPSGFTKGSTSFAGGVYDGTNIWLVPQSANMLIKVNAVTGAMTGFDNWPSGFTKGSSAFMGGVYDGKNVWMIPFMADRLMKFGDSSDLSGLTLSAGTLSPAFSASTTSYTANVGNEVTSIGVTPSTVDALATVTVNGLAATNGQAQVTALNVGDNTVTIVVTSINGNTKTYTVTLTRAASTNADLSGLTLSAGTLSPAFSAATTSYAANVGNEVTSVDVTPTAADADATMTVNGSAAASGQAQAMALNVGDNRVTVQVTAKDGTANKSYAVTVTRATYGSADLTGLTLSAGTLSPAFSMATTSYAANVGNEVTSVDVTPTAADAEATMTVNGSAIASGQAQAMALNVGDNTVMVQVTAKDGITKKSYTVTVTRMRANNTGNGDNGVDSNSSGTQGIIESNTGDTDTYTGILINGKVVNIGIITTSRRNEQTVTTITADPNKLVEMLKLGGEHSVVTIPFNNDSDVVIAELNGFMIKLMEENHFDLEIKSDKASYRIPAQQINIDAISRQVGTSVALKDITVQVEIALPTAENVKFVEDAARNSNINLIVPPLDFTVSAIYGNQQVEVAEFNAFIERSIVIPDNIDPNRITTGVVIDTNGTIHQVPTKVVQQDGKYFVIINSLSNSTYSVIWSSVEFSDVTHHWGKQAINDMGSRLIVQGTGEGIFSPDKPITRAEFAAIVVRGLGLKPESDVTGFVDVKASDWYSDAVWTAKQYQLISGFDDGSFRPMEMITREQAMMIISKAMTLTGLKDRLPVQDAIVTLRPFADEGQVASWAQSDVAACILAGIITGRSDGTIAAKVSVTRAEVTIMLQQLLKKSDLI